MPVCDTAHVHACWHSWAYAHTRVSPPAHPCAHVCTLHSCMHNPRRHPQTAACTPVHKHAHVTHLYGQASAHMLTTCALMHSGAHACEHKFHLSVHTIIVHTSTPFARLYAQSSTDLHTAQSLYTCAQPTHASTNNCIHSCMHKHKCTHVNLACLCAQPLHAATYNDMYTCSHKHMP